MLILSGDLWQESYLRCVTEVNSKHSVKLRPTSKLGLRSSSINIDDSQAASVKSGAIENENSFKETLNINFIWKNDRHYKKYYQGLI